MTVDHDRLSFLKFYIFFTPRFPLPYAFLAALRSFNSTAHGPSGLSPLFPPWQFTVRLCFILHSTHSLVLLVARLLSLTVGGSRVASVLLGRTLLVPVPEFFRDRQVSVDAYHAGKATGRGRLTGRGDEMVTGLTRGLVRLRLCSRGWSRSKKSYKSAC